MNTETNERCAVARNNVKNFTFLFSEGEVPKLNHKYPITY